MDQITARTRVVLAGLLAAVLLGVVGCGDDTGGDDNSQSGTAVPDSGEGAASDAELDACSLLDITEIGEQFGERGAVSVGQPSVQGTTSLCSWDIGDRTQPGSATLTLAATHTISQAIFDELTGDPVDGLGDEALLDGQSLHVRSGEGYFNLIVGIGDSDPVTSDSLITLAHAILDRL